MSFELQAGVARRIITPPKGIFLIGYGDRTRGNLGVHDDLTATALCLAAGDQRIAVVALDMLTINECIVDRVRDQLNGIEVFLCCSHTHSGPIAYADEQSSKPNREYINSLVNNIVAAVREAAMQTAPVQLSWSTGEAGIAINRREKQADGHFEIGRNPEGPVDRSVGILNILHQNGTRVATVVNYACHGTVLGPRNLLVSADWIGAMRSQVESQLGGLVLFLQGATANLNPDMDWESEGAFLTMQVQGESVAQRVVEAILKGNEPLQGAALQVERQEVWLPLETQVTSPTPLKKNYHLPLLGMAGLPGWMGFAVDALLKIRYPWKPRIAAREGRWHVPMRIGVARIGALALIAYGAEVFTEIGLKIKALSPARHTLFASITDGCISYLPTAAAHAEGGYEVDTAPYAYRYPGRLAEACEAIAVEETKMIFQKVYAIQSESSSDR